MKYKIVLNIILSFITALAIATAAAYADEPLSVRGHPTSTGTAPKRLALTTVKGIQDSVLTVMVNNIVYTITIDDKTKITRDGKPAVQTDIKEGVSVSISFIERTGRKVATAVEIRSGARPQATEPKPVLPQTPPMNKATPALRK